MSARRVPFGERGVTINIDRKSIRGAVRARVRRMSRIDRTIRRGIHLEYWVPYTCRRSRSSQHLFNRKGFERKGKLTAVVTSTSVTSPYKGDQFLQYHGPRWLLSQSDSSLGWLHCPDAYDSGAAAVAGWITKSRLTACPEMTWVRIPKKSLKCKGHPVNPVSFKERRAAAGDSWEWRPRTYSKPMSLTDKS